MLGSGVYKVLKDKYRLALTVRNPDKIGLLDKVYGGVNEHEVFEFDAVFAYQDFLNNKGYPGDYISSFLDKLGPVDYVINAIGIIIPVALKNPALTFFINGALPHILARIFGHKLIHITTDCVFNGKVGYPYNEDSPKTPVDVYGLSKSLGEPVSYLTLRTSIIGRELENFTSLLEWFRQQKMEKITGFANHFWNGITNIQFGKICDKIMSHPDEYPTTGLYHIFSTIVSKYEMLVKFEEKYHIGAEIRKDEEQKLNRTLTTIYDFNTKLQIPSFEEMLGEL